MKLLKEGSIDKTDFKGDVNKILGSGTVADKAVLTIKELRIGKNTVKNIDVTVNSRIKQELVFGDNTLVKFGTYSIDEKENKNNFIIRNFLQRVFGVAKCKGSDLLY